MRKKRRLDSADKKGKLASVPEAKSGEEEAAEAEIYLGEKSFSELVEKIDGSLMYLVSIVAKGRLDLVIEAINSYEEFVIENYEEHELYNSTPTIEGRCPILGAVAHELGYHEICDILGGNVECQVIGDE